MNFGATSAWGNGASGHYDYIDGTDRNNGQVNLTVPAGADFGPITITTAGGTSNAYALSFSGISSAASSGTPADATQASANIGQAITLNGTGFSL